MNFSANSPLFTLLNMCILKHIVRACRLFPLNQTVQPCVLFPGFPSAQPIILGSLAKNPVMVGKECLQGDPNDHIKVNY